jgi:hypothetical protein
MLNVQGPMENSECWSKFSYRFDGDLSQEKSGLLDI